jgi:GT2 family glycosyltransferase
MHAPTAHHVDFIGMARVYVVLLNWNGGRDTLACLESLLYQDYRELCVVVCDNASSDDSLLQLRAWLSGAVVVGLEDTPLGAQVPAPRPEAWAEYSRAEAERGGDPNRDPRWVLVPTGANLGFAGGCNVGIRYALARGDAAYVWLLNNDTVVAPDALSQLVAAMQRGQRVGIAGSTLRFYDDPLHVQALGGGTFSPPRAMTCHIGEGSAVAAIDVAAARRAEQDMVYVVGASMLVSRALLAEVGLMQEDYFLYFEELDWAERARRAVPPFTLAYAAGSMVFHKVGASAGTAVRSLFSLRHLTVNRLRFMKRFYPAWMPVARARLLWEAVKAALKGRAGEAGLLLRTAVSPVRT